MAIAPVNADQQAYWNSDNGRKWVDGQARLDQALDPLGLIGVDAAAPKSGETVIDVGCGCGSTSLVLADRVGPAGQVLGVDISAPMLGLAAERAQGRANLHFAEADASVHAFSDGAADLIFSRFGVMFFRNSVDAFINLYGALKPGGRLTFVCWRPLPLNDWMFVPLSAAAGLVDMPPPPPPDEPGPFAFADPDKVTGILTRSGFKDATAVPHDHPLKIADAGDLTGAVDFSLNMGPLGRLISDLPADTKAKIRAAVTSTMAARMTAQGLSLKAAVWVVTARKSA